MTQLTPTERAVIRHLSTTEPMRPEQLAKVAGVNLLTLLRIMPTLSESGFVSRKGIRDKGRFDGSGYILTPAGADLCESMERERAELNAIAAQATREHGEPDGDALIAQAMQSPRFFSPPVKPSLWARVKARLGLAA